MAAGVPWFALGSFGSGVGSLYLLAQLRDHRGKPGADWFVATIATITVWCVAAGIGALVFDPAIRLAVETVVWLCLTWIGVFFLAFALGYTGRTGLLEGWGFRAGMALPLATSALIVTNSLHGLVWEGFRVVESLGGAAAEYTILPLGQVAVLVAMLFVSFGTLLVFDTVVSYGPLYRREAVAVGLSPIPPGFALLAWAGGVGPVANLTTLFFLPHIALDTYAFVRSDMFEFHPATRRAGERAAIDDIATPVAIVDVDGRVVNLNPAAEGMLAMDKQAVLTRPLGDLLVGDAVSADGEPDQVTVENGGSPREFKIQQTELRDEGGTQLGYTVVFQDVTDEIRRERRLEVLNRFLRHNVRNEGVVIQARAALLAEDLTGDHAAHAETIEAAVDRLVESGTKARTLSEVGADDAAPMSVDLRRSVTAAVDGLTDEYVGEVTVSVPETLSLTTQPDLLEVVVENLVENALAHVDDPTVAVAATADSDDVVLTVSDDGPGVPDHELAVLDRGRETDLDHGSGIGLWLVRWATTALGGTLSFDTSDGTTATVRLPRDRTAGER
ncbi:histidine kinase N-terminal 7TM domain-containing protein [Halomicroarcula sp. GCM10025817]|uniref:histidine kinase N-terminal 7TM domain-containing protein n=1 Tax=Haloarcula TaxID=2237 RepID=UPI0023E75B75|nr:histidine kinase N-terminal 7TM domain-containing protein [Halomicroarcula sp. SYNS111]